jgi:hypothetical protein
MIVYYTHVYYSNVEYTNVLCRSRWGKRILLKERISLHPHLLAPAFGALVMRAS